MFTFPRVFSRHFPDGRVDPAASVTASPIYYLGDEFGHAEQMAAKYPAYAEHISAPGEAWERRMDKT
jgi:hypothetical protein